MRKSGKSSSRVSSKGAASRLLLLHLGPGLRQAIDPDEVYFVEAQEDDTLVRTRAARPLRDVRPMGVLEAPFLRHGFVRSHRNYLVNPLHVRQVRRRLRGDDWELQLAPPLAALWAAFGED